MRHIAPNDTNHNPTKPSDPKERRGNGGNTKEESLDFTAKHPINAENPTVYTLSDIYPSSNPIRRDALVRFVKLNETAVLHNPLLNMRDFKAKIQSTVDSMENAKRLNPADPGTRSAKSKLNLFP